MRIALIGRTEILYETAQALIGYGHSIVIIITAKEAPEYSKTSSDFALLAKKLKIPFASSHNIECFRNDLIETKPEIGISMNYTGIISQSIIDLFKFGILNAHGGDLPRYRGNACQAWAIINGEKKIGLCIHKMIGEEIDSGDIIARDFLDISDQTKIADVWHWMQKKVPLLFKEALKKLEINCEYVLETQSKSPKKVLRCYPRRPEDGLINWRLSSVEILRLINASSEPFSGAYCQFEAEKIIIWDASLIDEQEIFFAVPGQITFLGDGFIEVACGAGKLRVNSIEIGNYRGDPRKIIKSIRSRFV